MSVPRALADQPTPTANQVRPYEGDGIGPYPEVLGSAGPWGPGMGQGADSIPQGAEEMMTRLVHRVLVLAK